MGAVGFTVKRCEQLKSIVDQALFCKKPCVTDLHVDVNAEFHLLLEFGTNQQRQKMRVCHVDQKGNGLSFLIIILKYFCQ